MTLPEVQLAVIPMAMGAALQPLQVIALIMLLQTPRGLANGLAYAGGMTAFRLTLGALFWVLVSSVERAVESGGGQFDLIVGAVLTVLGLVLVVYALRGAFSAREARVIQRPPGSRGSNRCRRDRRRWWALLSLRWIPRTGSWTWQPSTWLRPPI